MSRKNLNVRQAAAMLALGCCLLLPGQLSAQNVPMPISATDLGFYPTGHRLEELIPQLAATAQFGLNADQYSITKPNGMTAEAFAAYLLHLELGLSPEIRTFSSSADLIFYTPDREVQDIEEQAADQQLTLTAKQEFKKRMGKIRSSISYRDANRWEKEAMIQHAYALESIRWLAQQPLAGPKIAEQDVDPTEAWVQDLQKKTGGPLAFSLEQGKLVGRLRFPLMDARVRTNIAAALRYVLDDLVGLGDRYVQIGSLLGEIIDNSFIGDPRNRPVIAHGWVPLAAGLRKLQIQGRNVAITKALESVDKIPNSDVSKALKNLQERLRSIPNKLGPELIDDATRVRNQLPVGPSWPRWWKNRYLRSNPETSVVADAFKSGKKLGKMQTLRGAASAGRFLTWAAVTLITMEVVYESYDLLMTETSSRDQRLEKISKFTTNVVLGSSQITLLFVAPKVVVGMGLAALACELGNWLVSKEIPTAADVYGLTCHILADGIRVCTPDDTHQDLVNRWRSLRNSNSTYGTISMPHPGQTIALQGLLDKEKDPEKRYQLVKKITSSVRNYRFDVATYETMTRKALDEGPAPLPTVQFITQYYASRYLNLIADNLRLLSTQARPNLLCVFLDNCLFKGYPKFTTDNLAKVDREVAPIRQTVSDEAALFLNAVEIIRQQAYATVYTRP